MTSLPGWLFLRDLIELLLSVKLNLISIVVVEFRSDNTVKLAEKISNGCYVHLKVISQIFLKPPYLES